MRREKKLSGESQKWTEKKSVVGVMPFLAIRNGREGRRVWKKRSGAGARPPPGIAVPCGGEWKALVAKKPGPLGMAAPRHHRTATGATPLPTAAADQHLPLDILRHIPRHSHSFLVGNTNR